jgi:CSLREA domain-containing protein
MRTIRKRLVLIILAMSLAGSEAMAAVIPVTVAITAVTNISAGDGWGNLPDFYARINIAGQSHKTPTVIDTASVFPVAGGGWSFEAFVSTRMSGKLIPIRIEIWDWDPAILQGADDLVDVDPDECPAWVGCSFATVDRPPADTRGLDLTLDLTTGAFKGYSSSPIADASGGGTTPVTPVCATGTESEAAAVCFTITVDKTRATPEELVVTKREDTDKGRCLQNDCSLREAVNAAWLGDTVAVPDLGGSYLLTYRGVLSVPPVPSDEPGHLKITQKLKICGRDGGAVIVQTLANTRVFDIHGGADVEICNLTITGGTAGLTSTAAANHLHGGGIHNHGTATLRNVTISNNSAPYDVAVGGGAGFYNAGNAYLDNVTITQNTANSGAGGIESNIATNTSGETHLRNTLIANNTGNPLPGNCNPAQGFNSTGNVKGFFDQGGNLQFPGTSCGTAIPTAPTQPISAPDTKGTYPLTAQGGAIDGGTTPCPSKDQLGLQRPLDGNNDGNPVCDVGAREMPPGVSLPQGPPGLGTTISSPLSPHPAH